MWKLDWPQPCKNDLQFLCSSDRSMNLNLLCLCRHQTTKIVHHKAMKQTTVEAVAVWTADSHNFISIRLSGPSREIPCLAESSAPDIFRSIRASNVTLSLLCEYYEWQCLRAHLLFEQVTWRHLGVTWRHLWVTWFTSRAVWAIKSKPSPRLASYTECLKFVCQYICWTCRLLQPVCFSLPTIAIMYQSTSRAEN